MQLTMKENLIEIFNKHGMQKFEAQEVSYNNYEYILKYNINELNLFYSRINDILIIEYKNNGCCPIPCLDDNLQFVIEDNASRTMCSLYKYYNEYIYPKITEILNVYTMKDKLEQDLNINEIKVKKEKI